MRYLIAVVLVLLAGAHASAQYGCNGGSPQMLPPQYFQSAPQFYAPPQYYQSAPAPQFQSPCPGGVCPAPGASSYSYLPPQFYYPRAVVIEGPPRQYYLPPRRGLGVELFVGRIR